MSEVKTELSGPDLQDIEANVPRGRKSAVRRVRRLAGKRLTFMLGAEDDTLAEFAAGSKTGRAGKTLIKEGALRITLVALKKGTVLPSHQVAGPVSFIATCHDHLPRVFGGTVITGHGASLITFSATLPRKNLGTLFLACVLITMISML